MKPVHTNWCRQRWRRCSGPKGRHSRRCSLCHRRPWQDASSASATALMDSSGPRAPRNSRKNPSAAFCAVVAQFLVPPITAISSPTNPWRTAGEVIHDYSSLCMENARRLSADAMIVTGGDGKQHIARDFFTKGVNVVGAPKTIDNDRDATEVTFGFDTAVVIATEAIDRLHTTAESHHRAMLVEGMGRDAGWIALHDGTGGGRTSSWSAKSPSNSKLSATPFAPANFAASALSWSPKASKCPLLIPPASPFPRSDPVAWSTASPLPSARCSRRESAFRSRPRPAWWLPYNRSHPRHSLRRRRHRFGRQWTIWPHGLPQGW